MRALFLAGLMGSTLLLAVEPALAAGGYSEEVTTFTTHDGLVLEGIVSYPADGPGPFPGLLLLPGSGLHDADVTLNGKYTNGQQKLFRRLARFLSRNGYAVMRYNKRGATFEHAHDRPDLLARSSLNDLIEDARNAFLTMRSHAKTDASRLAVLGHSEGSLIASHLAVEHKDIQLLILVGSTAHRLDRVLHYQLVERNLNFMTLAADFNGDGQIALAELRRLGDDFGMGSLYISNMADLLFEFAPRRGSGRVRGLQTTTDINRDGRLHIQSELAPALESSAREFIAQAGSGVLGTYLESLLAEPPLVTLIASVDARILFFQGELDVQTPLSETKALVRKLEEEGRANYELVVFPNLGHSLSRPMDFYLEDGGLTVLDNPTLNAPTPRALDAILAGIDAFFN